MKWIRVVSVCVLGACSNNQILAPSPNGLDGGVDNDAGAGLDASPDAGQVTEPSGRWQSRGPGGGGCLFAPAISPHNVDEIFLSSDMSPIFHTTNFGRSWGTLNFASFAGDTYSRVGYTSNASVLYALAIGEDDGAIPKKSVDGGKTFTAITDPSTAHELRYLFTDPRSSDKLLVADEKTIQLSADGGKSFQLAYTCKADGGCIVGGAFWDTDRVYLGTADGLLTSSDGGKTFLRDNRSGLPSTEGIVSFAGGRSGDQARLVAVTYKTSGLYTGVNALDQASYYGGVYRLDLANGNWERATAGFASSARFGNVAMASSNASVAYVAGAGSSSPVVYKTIDSGATWQSVLTTASNSNIDTGWMGSGGDLDWGFADGALSVEVAPTDPNRVLFTDWGYIHTSRDGGGSWQQAYVNPDDQNAKGAATPQGRTYRTSGIEQTSVWALTWPDDKTIFASFTDIHSARSTDSGERWERSGKNGLPYNTTYHAVVHPKTGAVYAATGSVHDLYQSPFLQDTRIDGGSGAVMVSTNRGETFSTLYNFAHNVVWLALDPQNPDQLYASVVHSSLGGIYRIDLTNSKAAPVKLAAPPRTKGHPLTVRVLSDGTLVASYSARRETNANGSRGPYTESSGVFMLPKGATTWTDVSAVELRYWTKDVVIDPNDKTENTWYAGAFSDITSGNKGGLFRTTDRGKTWKRIASPSQVESCTVHPTKPNVMYVTSETQGLYMTENLSAESPTFTRVDDFPFRHPLRVFFNPQKPSDVWVTSFGGGIRTATIE